MSTSSTRTTGRGPEATRVNTPRPLGPNVLGVIAQIARAPIASVAPPSAALGAAPVTTVGVTPLALSVPAPRRDALSDVASRALANTGSEVDDVTLAWELAHLVAAPRRAEAFSLVMRVLAAAQSGSTRITLRAPSRVADAESWGEDPQLELPFDARVRSEPALTELAPLLGSFAEGSALVRSGEHVALRRWSQTERAIAHDLKARAAPHASLEARRERATELVRALRDAPLPGPRGPMLLTDEQEAAVIAMMTERTVVLTGGPGTGKTSVVVSLLRAIARRAHAAGGEAELVAQVRLVALAAPTGKAADRLGEAVRTSLSRSSDPIDALIARHLQPRTIHRLLGYRHRVGRSGEGSFRAHRHNPLVERLVLVDEVSMIDTVLFERLLAAVSPEASLVLLGDPDQLPSVDPGAVLRDLLRAAIPSVCVHRLTKSHRMDPSDPDGAHVLSVARACLSLDADAPPFRRPAVEDRTTPVGRGGAWHLDAPGLRPSLDAWIERQLFVPALGALDAVEVTSTPDRNIVTAPSVVLDALSQLSRARILTVTRRVAEDLDAYVAASFARWRGEPVRARRVLPGEPVMVVHNDYDEDLWNGDSGVAWRDRAGELFVSFRRGLDVRTRPLAAVAHLVERSHAVTVHKAQGSEHDEILFVMPAADTVLSSREIVYTAITRARRSAIVVGRPELLATALARASSRETGLVEALVDAR